MGTWGHAIFADDVASDVRDDFRFFLADAQSVERATEEIAESYGASFEDLSSDTAFWLGLALTQWRMGLLDRRVRDAALRIIEDGLDLDKWEGSPDRSKRASALAKARAKLLSPMSPASRIPKPVPVQLADWKIGEVVGFRTNHGRLVLLHVVRFSRCSKFKVKAPAVSFLNWFNDGMPSQEEVSSLTNISHPLAPSGIQTMPKLILAAPRREPLDTTRFIRPGLYLDLLADELPGSGIAVISDNGETLDSVIGKALLRWWDDPTLSPKALAPWMAKRR